jgi:glycosyltransferase involved in cell wall biosynthesis
MNSPRLTIVTPSFQQAQYLEQTLDSVLSQNYPNLEYLVIDGGSTDGSIDILRKYEKHLTFWVSEKDRGQAHALNKGFARATGTIQAYINSDDYYEPGVFARAAELLTDANGTKSRTLLVGNVVNFGGEKTTLSRYTHPAGHEQLRWFAENPIHQPGTFWTADLMRDFGPFDESLRYTFDFDFFAKIRFRGDVIPLGVDEPFAHFRWHEQSKTMSSWPKFEAEFEQVRRRITEHCPALRAPAARIRAEKLQVQCLYSRDAGESRRAWAELWQSIQEYPWIAMRRRTAGCVRRLLTRTA